MTPFSFQTTRSILSEVGSTAKIGSIMAELIDACEAGRDHDRDPVRVKLPRTAFEVDVSFFSRLRSAQASSGTVLA